MKNALEAFRLSYQLLWRDKVSLLLSLIPIGLGVLIMVSVGHIFYGELTQYGQKLVEEYISNDSAGKFFGYFFTLLFSVMMYFIVSWSFVLMVSIIASPFNDLLSQRLEKQLLKQELPSLGESLSSSFPKILATILNEIKKVSFVLGLSALAFFIGLFPLLAPLSLAIGAIVIACEFLDFSWSRHDLALKECRKSLRANFLAYLLGGVFFMIIIAIPFVGIIVPSWGTSFFTVLWVRNNEHRYKITQ